MQRARQDARVDELIEIGNCEVWRCDGRAARLGHNEAGRSNVAPIFERRDMGQKTRHAASVSQKGVCILAPVGVGGESLRGIGVISGACPLAGLSEGRLDRWLGCSMAGLHRTGPGRVHGCFWSARSVRAVCRTRHLETQSEDCPGKRKCLRVRCWC